MYNKDEQIDLLYSAIKEIEKRLGDVDWESSLSICGAVDIALKYGINSPELETHLAIENARLS